jgi:hypothetical protein
VPTEKTIIAKYRAPILRVAQPRTKPRIATLLAIVMCHVRSLYFPEDHDQYTLIAPAIRYGGHVKTKVMVVSKPRVSTTVGNLK